MEVIERNSYQFSDDVMFLKKIINTTTTPTQQP